MESITVLRKVGGSLVTTIPRKIVDLEQLSSGQAVRIVVEPVRKSFFGAVKGIGSFTKNDERWAEGRDE
ncbi:hypothetical protein HY483_02315 [Candidatus Woesearchaeota archaeon]|nr:hypothetical protein [Candidatus Woesearchaeota archaeon]